VAESRAVSLAETAAGYQLASLAESPAGSQPASLAGSAVAGPAVSVVVATRNRREQLLATLGNLQSISGDPPVILVDNGSTDGSAEAVESAFPGVTVLRAGRNLGATGRTLGVRAATTPYVAFCDDDSWWAPDALDRAAGYFAALPQLGLIAGRILIGPDERPDPVCAEMAASPLGQPAGLPGPAVLGFIACGAVVRRSAYLEVGGFDPVVFFLGEETLLAQDLATAGWSLCYLDDVVAHHHPQPGGDRHGRRRLQHRNALLSTWMRRPYPIMWRDTVALARRGGDPDLRGALLDATRRLPAALARRRTLPAHVEAEVRLLEGAVG
jgi:GT2 family glycosyltransferase